MQWLAIVAWRCLALMALVLGGAGAVLPGLPTVPFLLLAAWAGSKGWPELEARLLAHPHYGVVIRRWRTHRAVPRRAKWLASVFMAISVAGLLLSPAPLWLRWFLPVFLLLVAAWLWRRPE